MADLARGGGDRRSIAGENEEKVPVLRRAKSSDESRAANPYDAPRKHELSIAVGGGNRKGSSGSSHLVCAGFAPPSRRWQSRHWPCQSPRHHQSQDRASASADPDLAV